MKELTPEECKDIQLNILIDVAKFCEEHNIKYSLAYGTLIGAIRHKGFIPWDDDIDIIMMREEYEKFVSTYPNSKYFLIRGEDTPNHLHERVIDMTTSVIYDNPDKVNLYDGGLWVDIFPIDYAPDVEKMYKNHMKKIWFYGWLERIGDMRNPKPNSKFRVILNIAHFIIRPFRRIFGKFAKRRMTYFNKEKTNTLANFSLWYLQYPSFPASFMSEFIEVEFQGYRFKTMKQYDDFLKGIYGDYMQLPPLDKRTPRHKYKAFRID